MFCFKQIILFQTMELRVDAEEEFSSDKHGFEIWRRAQMHRKFSTEMKRPNKVNTVQTKCLDPKYQLYFFVNKENLHNLDMKHRLINITFS